MDEEQLAGGITNVGTVVRAGPHVLRPVTPHSESTNDFLRALQERRAAFATALG